MVTLGKLTKINDLRKVWADEARNFTPWLAKEENLEILGNEVGLDIELMETEAKTGSFSTDILAKDVYTDDKVIIENQLEQTDHDHLGKLMVYAAGHDAKTIIWIVKEVREEHRQAVDWINEHTDTEVNLFLIKIELWQIGDSDIAPKFNIISSPNNWSKTIKKTQQKDKTELELKQLDYWNKFRNYVDNNSIIFKPIIKPKPQNYYILHSKRGCFIEVSIDSNKKFSYSEIYIPNNKELYDYLYEQKETIEKKIGESLFWDKKDNRKVTKIRLSRNINPTDTKNWDKLIKLQLSDAEKLYSIFNPLITDYVSKN